MLPEVFNHQFNGIVWKIIADENQHFLAIEVRNTDLRNTTFFILDLEKAQFFAQNLTTIEPWWVGIEAISEYFLYLHHYDSQTYAQHKDIIGISLNNKNKSFLMKNHTFLGLENGFLFSLVNQKNIKSNALNGVLVEENILKKEKKEDFTHQILKIQEEDAYFMKLQQFILTFSGFKAVRLIEYLDFKNYIIISFYYETLENKLQNELYVLSSENASILLKVELGNNLTGVGTNSFCVLKNKLVFCKNKNTIIIHEL